MKFRTPFAALAVATLALAACGDDDTTAPIDDPGVTDELPGDDAPDIDDPPAGDPLPAPDDDVPEIDLPDGVAASVGATEIAVATVEGIFDEVSTAPAFEMQIDGDDTGAGASMLRAQVLSQLVVQEIIEDAAADDFGIEVSDADLDASLARVEAETEPQGGLDAALEGSGLNRETFLLLELPLIALLDQLEAEFGDLQPDPEAAPGEVPEGQAELQEWGADAFATADVSISPDYGVWDPVSGQVQPTDMPDMPVMPDEPAPAPG
jgi:hypothetical protein